MIGLNGGLIGVRRVPALQNASGTWVVNEQVLARRANIWPRTGGDPYWSNVSMLLHMDGSNGSTIVADSSSNNLSVLTFGNAQISTAQSKFGNASCVFDGDGDYISTNTNTALQFSSSNFTVEMWARFSVISNQALYETGQVGASGSRSTGFLLYLTSAGNLKVFHNGQDRGTSATTLSSNTWYYLALVRAGNTFTFYINGTADANTFTISSSFTDSSFVMGRLIDTPSYYLNGYIDEVRVTKGVARSITSSPTEAFVDY